MSTREKAEILNEFKTNESLRDTLDIVEIVMGFISSGKYKPDLGLGKFVSKLLKMEGQFKSKKVFVPLIHLCFAAISIILNRHWNVVN